MVDIRPVARPAYPDPVSEVSARELVRMSRRTFAAHRARVLLPAVVVFGVAAFGDALLAHLDHTAPLWVGALAVVLQAVATLGLTFYAGLLDRLVGAVERGEEVPGIGRVLVTLPYVQLIAADIVLWLIGVASAAVLLLPAMIAMTFFAIVGPLINLEGHGVVTAFRRSAKLVGPHFWLVMALVTLPLTFEHEALAAIQLAVPNESIVLLFVTDALVGIAFGTVVGLLEVSIAETLLQRSRGGPPAEVADVPVADADSASGSPPPGGGRSAEPETAPAPTSWLRSRPRR